MSDTFSDWYVIINPHAGSGKTMSEWKLAEARLCEYGIPYKPVYTGHKSHAKELSEDAARQGYRHIMAVGGDGSVHEVMTGIMNYCSAESVDPSEFYMAVIPIGSGNDWIKSLGVPHDTLAVIDLVRKASFVRQDIVRVTDASDHTCYMANIGGAGFDSQVCVRVNAQKERGYRSRFIYFMSLIHTILHLDRFHAAVEMDGETVYDGPCFSIAFGNGKYSGGGMRQTSLSEIDDGLLDVLVIPVVSLLRIAREIPRLFTGTIHETKCLIYRRCRKVVLRSEPSIPYEVDGEVEGSTDVSVEMTGQQMNVLAG